MLHKYARFSAAALKATHTINQLNLVADAESKLGLYPELISDDLYLENDLYLWHTGAHRAIKYARLSSSNCDECEKLVA